MALTDGILRTHTPREYHQLAGIGQFRDLGHMPFLVTGSATLRQRHGTNLRSKAIVVVGRASKGEGRGCISHHTAIQSIDVLSTVLGSSIDAGHLPNGLIQRFFQLVVPSANALLPRLPA